MQSGYTCHRCLSSIRRAINASSTVRQAHSGPSHGGTGRRHYTPFNKRSTPIPTQQRRTVASVASRNEIAVPIGPGAPRYATPFGADEPTERPERVLIKPENLFHSFSNSPAPGIRRRAAFMKSHAYCPHPDHRQTRVVLGPQDPEVKKAANKSNQPPAFVNFECPDCGIPVYCSEKHWMDDYESHSEICDTLRQANEDDHDLHSGRYFPEFRYPGPQIEEILVNMTNWDTYLYTREFNAINEDRSMRQATRMLTYPVTIASIIHELSPYDIRAGGRLTVEGLKSLSGTFFSFHVLKTVLMMSSSSLQPPSTPVRRRSRC